ncbi:ACT domain protein [Candidatus Bilamarchaeum dharawalense]|uniref:ACT domain protein n=1 Tax=Candidatus Bilamarchaeum dharawalense TaxID=2885759 RepID=A0A5E4LWG7_9ARCH|nr:ACT domain protein [Candidatus Bilamarchaeum dharawalense]
MKSVTIISDDRVGLLADISYILGKSGVNIDGLFVDVVGGKAVISIEVKDPKKASTILEGNGFSLAHPEAIVVKVSGDSMEKLTEMLEIEDITVTELSMLSADKEDGVFAIQVDKPRKAYKMLSPFLLGHNGNQYY